MTDILAERIYNMVENKNLTTENILSITVDIMYLTQTEIKGKNKGDLKKEIVICVLKKIVDEHIQDEELCKNLNMMINTCVPSAINTMVQIARGEIDLKKTIKSCLSFCLR